MELRLTDWGIAYAYGNIIEINRKLLKYPKLYNQVLQHEKEHLKKPSFKDTLKIDFKDLLDFKKQKYMSKILKKEPLMYLQSGMPIWIQDKKICFNPFLLFFYGITMIPLALIIFII